MTDGKDNLRGVYNTLKSEGYNPPDFEQFAKDMEDIENLRGVYSTLQKEGYTPPDFDVFRNDMGFYNTRGANLAAGVDEASNRAQRQAQRKTRYDVAQEQYEQGRQQTNATPISQTAMGSVGGYGISPMGMPVRNTQGFPQANPQPQAPAKPMAPAPRAGQWSGAPTTRVPFAPTEEEGNTQYMPLEQGEDTKARYDAQRNAVGGQGGQVETMRSDIDSRLQEAYQRDLDNYGSELDKGGFWARMGRSVQAAEGNNPAANAVPSQLSDDTRDYQAAKHALDNSQKIIDEANAASRNGNFFAGAGRGMRDKFFDVSTWDFGITDVTDQAAILRALEAYDKGEQLTESQRALLDAKAVELATTAYFGSELGRGYKAGQVTAEAIPFMIEMAINPAAGVGKGASKAMVRYALKKFGKEAIQKGGKRYVAKQAMKYGTRIALDPVGAGGMAATTGAARTAADAMQRMAGNLHYGTDEQGNITFDGHTDAESVMKAFGKAFASTTIENYSEMLGKYFGPALGLLGKGASKVGKGIARTKAGAAVGRGMDKISGVFENAYNSTISKKIGLQAVGDFIGDIPAGKAAEFLSELEKRAQWHGVMGEYTEEVLGGLLNALVVGDQTLDKDPDTGLFNWDNNVDTFLGVALMGGFFAGVKTVGYGVERAHNARQYNKASRMGAAAFGDGWADVQSAIENDPKAGAVAVLADPNSTKEQREAALRYAAAVAARQGMEQGKAKRDAEGVQTQQEAAAEQSYNTGYEDANTDELRSDINMAYTDARQTLVGLIGEDAVNDIDSDPLAMQAQYDQDMTVDDNTKYAIAEYVSAKSAWDGVQQRIADDAEDRAEAVREAYKPMTREDGSIHPVTLNVEGADGQPKTVYLLDGSDVVLNPDGSIDREKSSTTLTAYDPEQGKNIFIDDPYGDKGIQSVGEVTTPEALDQLAGGGVDGQGALNTGGNNEQGARIPMDGQDARNPQDGQGARAPERTPGAPEAYTPGMVMGVVDNAGQEHVAEIVGRVRFDKGKFVPDENGMFVEYTVDGQTRKEAADKLNGKVRWHETAAQPQQPITAAEGQQPTAGQTAPQDGVNDASDTRTPAQRTYDDIVAKLGADRASHKIDATAKVKADRLAKAEKALKTTQETADNTEYGSKEEQKAEAAVVKAQAEYEAAQQDMAAWEEVRKLRDQALIAQSVAEDAARKAERDRRLAEESEAQRKQREAYAAEQARRKAEAEAAEKRRQEENERLRQQAAEAAANPQPAEPKAPIEGTKGQASQLEIARQELADDLGALAMLEDIEPRTLEEVAAHLLSSGKNQVKLQKDDFMRDTGYGPEDVKKYPFIFAGKEKGGITIALLGEMIENEARDSNIPFDENDAMAGVTAALNMLGSVGSQADINGYIANSRIQQAYDYHNAALAAARANILEAYGMTEDEYESYMSWLEDAIEQGKSTLSDEEFNQIFNVYEQGQTTDAARGNQEGAATTERTEGAETDTDKNGERGNGETDAGTGEQAAVSKAETAQQPKEEAEGGTGTAPQPVGGVPAQGETPAAEQPSAAVGEGGDKEPKESGKNIADVEAGGAVVDKLEKMGVEVSADIAENRRVRKQAENDKSENGKIHELRTTDGKVYGFAYRGKLYLDPRKIDAELPLHEYAHLWTEALRMLNPKKWAEVVEQIKQDKDAWQFIKSTYPDLKTDSEIADEVIATFSGKNGAEKLKAALDRFTQNNPDYKSRWNAIFNSIAKALQDFWKAVGDFLNIKYESAEQVYDQVLKDFVSGMNPRARVEKYLQERETAYMQAAERGDVAKATEIFNQALSEEIGNGMTPFIAVGRYDRASRIPTLAHKVKSHDPKAIDEVAELIAPIIPKNAVLVPAPSHNGRATDMLDLAKAIAKRTGSEVADVLTSAPRDSQYETKKRGGLIASQDMGITMTGTLPEGKIPVVIDNVVGSGNTAEACVRAIGKGLVVSLGDAADRYNHAVSLKSAAPILRDRNNNIVPLSKRFELGGSQYLGRSAYERADGKAARVSAKERKLRDAIVDLLRKAGIDVVTESEEGQRVLDMANGRGVTLNKAQKRILETAPLIQEEGSRADISSIDGAKVLKNLDILAEKLEKSSSDRKYFFQEVGNALNAKQHGSKSQYATFETKNGQIVTIRLGNHNATVSRFDNNGEDNGISIVISRRANQGITNDGNAHLVEYFYSDKAINKADGKPLADIVRSIKQALYSGEYKDTTGLAEREEVNAEQVRLHRVYHGSGADFERFDHSHMGEGEGAQAFGWGTYVTEVEGIGRHYAENLPKVWFRDTESGFEVDWKEVRDNWEEGVKRSALLRVYENARGADYNMEKAIENAISEIDGREGYEEELAFLRQLTADDFEIDRNLYTVEIPEDNGSNYIDWTKKPGIRTIRRLVEQMNDKQKERISRIPVRKNQDGEEIIDKKNIAERILWHVHNSGWGNLYEVAEIANGGKYVDNEKSTAMLLHSAGFVGIKYTADYYNGGRADNAKNYVIFNEGDLQIIDKVKFFRTESGEAYGFTMGGKIYFDPKIATAETPIHEYTHLWAAALRAANPKAWEQLKSELTKDTELVAYVRRLYPELAGANGANGLSDELAEEVFAHFSGRRGAERLREEQRKAMDEASDYVEKAGVVAMFERLRDALRRFWNMARDLFAGKTRGINSRSAEDYADMVLADLVGGFKPDRVDRLDRNDREGDDDIQYEKVGGDENDNRAVTIIGAEKEHGFANFGEARKWAKKNIVGEYNNPEIGGVNISGTAIDKYLSEKAVSKSDNKDVHLSALKVMPSIIENSIVGEIHDDKNRSENVKDIVRLYGAIDIDREIYRVKTTVKRYKNDNEKTKAYSYEVTEIELLEGTHGDDINNPLPRTTNNSISAAKLLNISETAKNNSQETEREEIAQRDKEYAEAVAAGDKEKIDAMLREEMRRKGYADNSDYQGSLAFNGAAPSSNAYFETREERKEAFDEGELEGDFSLGDFMEAGIDTHDLEWQLANPIAASARDKATLESINNLRSAVRGKKKTIKMYRAVPADLKEGSFRNGDWVTPSRKYAEQHIELQDWEGGRIIEQEVSVDDIWWNGDDINEWGFDDGKGYAYKNTENNRKLMEPTYDDNGNLIPLSERFTDTESDVRFRGEEEPLFRPKTQSREGGEEANAGEWYDRNSVERIGEYVGYSPKQIAAMNARQEESARRQFREAAEKLHLGDRITFVDTIDEVEGIDEKQRKAWRRKKGWYSPRTGKIVIILGNHRSMDDVMKSILHEGVAHHGLRQMFGKHFDTFLDNVYLNASPEIRGRINEMAEKHGWDFREATEEYLAMLAEDTDFEKPENQSWWRQVKAWFFDMLHKIGFKLQDMYDTITDNELRYILWRSYENLVHPGRFNSVVEEAKDIAKQYELKVGQWDETWTVAAEAVPNATIEFNGRRVPIWATNGRRGNRADRGDRKDRGIRADRKGGDEWSRAAAEAKRHWPDAMVLERVGDFYEVHGEDARNAAKVLGLPLVQKADGNNTVGFPTYAVNTYLPKLVRAGQRVAIVDSVEEGAVVYGGEDVEAVNARFNEELQQQIDGTLPKGHVYNMGMPSGVLRSTGFPNVPIELSASHLADKAKASHHPFALGDVKGLVEALQHPIAVFVYGDKGKAQNVIVEIQHEGKNFGSSAKWIGGVV